MAIVELLDALVVLRVRPVDQAEHAMRLGRIAQRRGALREATRASARRPCLSAATACIIDADRAAGSVTQWIDRRGPSEFGDRLVVLTVREVARSLGA